MTPFAALALLFFLLPMVGRFCPCRSWRRQGGGTEGRKTELRRANGQATNQPFFVSDPMSRRQVRWYAQWRQCILQIYSMLRNGVSGPQWVGAVFGRTASGNLPTSALPKAGRVPGLFFDQSGQKAFLRTSIVLQNVSVSKFGSWGRVLCLIQKSFWSGQVP